MLTTHNASPRELREGAALPMVGAERRTLGSAAIRATDATDTGGLITGYAAVFNSPTTIGNWFREQIAPGAFAKAILTDDVRALINHDESLILGRNVAGTLRLSEDAKGLAIEVDTPDTQYARDLAVSMKRGDVTQMSFGFQSLREEWDETDPNMAVRTILEASLFDVSIVTYPAYDDTVAEASSRRSFDRWRAQKAEAAPPETNAVRLSAVAASVRMKHALFTRGISRR